MFVTSQSNRYIDNTANVLCEQHSYATTQIELPQLLSSLLVIRSSIDSESFHREDYENPYEPHITIAYYLDDIYYDIIHSIVGATKVFAVQIRSDIQYFHNDECDVAYLPVFSNGLHALYEKLARFQQKNTYREYTPHVTIAYLQKNLPPISPIIPHKMYLYYVSSVSFRKKDGTSYSCMLTL